MSGGSDRPRDESRGEADAVVRDLYREQLLTHARAPHHFGTLAHATDSARGYNPLCGDALTLMLRKDGEVIAEAAFEGAGCALSLASASILTDALTGATLERARALQAAVIALVTGSPDAGVAGTEASAREAVGAGSDVAALGSVRAFPARWKCVTLAWTTLAEALGESTP